MSHRKSILYHLRVLDSKECNEIDDYDCWFEIIFWEGWGLKNYDMLNGIMNVLDLKK